MSVVTVMQSTSGKCCVGLTASQPNATGAMMIETKDVGVKGKEREGRYVRNKRKSVCKVRKGNGAGCEARQERGDVAYLGCLGKKLLLKQCAHIGEAGICKYMYHHRRLM